MTALDHATERRPGLLAELVERNGALRVWVSLGLLGGIILLGFLAPLLPLHNPVQPNPAQSLQPPSWDHWFGTDRDGMDVFSRTIFAIRTDFTLALSSVLVGVLIGVPLGAIAGFFGGWLDGLLTRIVEVAQGFPQILFGMAFLAAAGNTMQNLILVVAFYNIPVYAKLVRSAIIPLRDIDYVQAARVAGSSELRIVLRQLIPNTLTTVFGQLPLSSAYAVQMIAGLSFIGLGVAIPTPEWGSMIQTGANYIVFGKWWVSVFPGLALFLSVWILNMTSDLLRSLLARRS